jgi:hypothetical protein
MGPDAPGQPRVYGRGAGERWKGEAAVGKVGVPGSALM